MKTTMKLDDIKIKRVFKKKYPTKHKMDECRSYYLETGKYDRYIKIDKNGFLVDGYVMYLVLKENKVEDVEVIKCATDNASHKLSSAMYVHGIHRSGGKEYIWKLNKSKEMLDILPGDSVVVDTKYGRQPIIVTKIETLDFPPVSYKIKNVIRKV